MGRGSRLLSKSFNNSGQPISTNGPERNGVWEGDWEAKYRKGQDGMGLDKIRQDTVSCLYYAYDNLHV